jgi:hypothetical protein
MGRLAWTLALVVTFILGWIAAGIVRRPAQQVERLQAEVGWLEQHVSTLQARLQAREGFPGSPRKTTSGNPPEVTHTERAAALGAATSSRATGPAAGPRLAGTAPTDGGRATAPPPTVQAALDRFYSYMAATRGTDARERWREARKLLAELREMGDAAAEALMHVLASGADSDERRAAARLLGNLQVARALPFLRDVLDSDGDLLLRRAAASGLRQLQTPESLPVMERLLANPGEDRMVRLSAAFGLAEAGRPQGVTALARIFDEAAADGRGRESAFRALAALNDERSLPFMRQVAGSDSEPGYRLRAIRYLAAQGDRQALDVLQVVMNSPREQPSIRDAAASAYRILAGL